jgi:DNA-binding NtrC family response regulator
VATVLVLEDDEDNLLVLEAALEMSGFDVKTARSCAEAEAKLVQGEVDALVSDYSLPDGNAIDWLQRIGERRPRVALLLTGYGDAEARAASKAAGFAAHLLKPIAPTELERQLKRALDSAAD